MANFTMTTLKTHQNNMNSIVIIGASSGIGKEVAKKVDFLICIGEKAKLIAESAIKHNFDKNKILIFNNSDSAKKMIKKEIGNFDVILIKGSHAMQLDKIVEELKRENENEN